MGREREEVGEEVIHFDGEDKTVVGKIVCWFVSLKSY
jgi:hypothetical protein